MSRTFRFVVLASVFLGTACVSSFTHNELRDRLLTLGRDEQSSRQPLVFPIHAETKMEEWTLLADARTEPRSRTSLDLAQQIAIGRSRRVRFVVGGPHVDLNRQVVTNALAYHDGRTLPGLTVVYVSPEAPGEALEALARERRVTLIHRTLE